MPLEEQSCELAEIERLDGRLLLPIALSPSLLLHFLGVGIDVTALGKITGQMLNVVGGPISETGMVTVILLVGASHFN